MDRQYEKMADLIEALEGEHRILKGVQKILRGALPPDSGMSDADVVSELWKISEFDRGNVLEAAEIALARAKGLREGKD